MKLYEIQEAMLETLDIFLESDQEQMDRDVYEDTINYLKEELSQKSSNLIKYLCNLHSETTAIKEEIERLSKAKKARESKLESLKGYLVNVMQSLEKSKIETDLGTYGLRKSKSVAILDQSKIPEEYIRVKEEVTVDKKGLAAVLKSGEAVEGAALVENYSLQIR